MAAQWPGKVLAVVVLLLLLAAAPWEWQVRRVCAGLQQRWLPLPLPLLLLLLPPPNAAAAAAAANAAVAAAAAAAAAAASALPVRVLPGSGIWLLPRCHHYRPTPPRVLGALVVVLLALLALPLLAPVLCSRCGQRWAGDNGHGFAARHHYGRSEDR